MNNHHINSRNNTNYLRAKRTHFNYIDFLKVGQLNEKKLQKSLDAPAPSLPRSLFSLLQYQGTW